MSNGKRGMSDHCHYGTGGQIQDEAPFVKSFPGNFQDFYCLFLIRKCISSLIFCGTGLYYTLSFRRHRGCFKNTSAKNGIGVTAAMDITAENNTGHLSEEFVLNNPYGLHARPASVFVQTAMEFQSDVQVCNLSNNMTADGKSVLSMLMLAAPVGTRIRITVDGQDASRAMDSLRNLVLRGFDDE